MFFRNIYADPGRLHCHSVVRIVIGDRTEFVGSLFALHPIVSGQTALILLTLTLFALALFALRLSVSVQTALILLRRVSLLRIRICALLYRAIFLSIIFKSKIRMLRNIAAVFFNDELIMSRDIEGWDHLHMIFPGKSDYIRHLVHAERIYVFCQPREYSRVQPES